MRRLALVSLLLCGGCVYYNGMYNARKYTHEAEKAEREGRTLDASTAWGQVTVKAETLLARHPASRYAPAARVLMGRAYARLGDCTSARTALEPGLAMIRDSVLLLEGQLALARCYVKLDEPARAIGMYRQVLAHAPDTLQAVLQPELIRAVRFSGDYERGLELVDTTAPGLAGERMALLAGAGHFAEAQRLADSLATAGDTLAPWDSTAAAAGRRDPRSASRIVDAMLRINGTPADRRARWLLADGERLAPVDTSAAMARYRAAIETRPPEDVRSRARLAMLRLGLSHAATPGQLDSFVPELQQEADASSLASDASVLLAAVQEILEVRDSVSAATPRGDLRTFLAGESARDVLRAPFLARAVLVSVADRWPASPYAAKALLAAHLLAPEDTALMVRIDSVYGASPYVLAMQGDDVPELRALEDSLGAFARSEVRPATRGRRPPAAAPGTSRKVTTPGQRAPELR